MRETGRSGPPSLWAYAYEIAPPLPAGALHQLALILENENAAALSMGRKWNGRLVLEQASTHILIVSQSSAQDTDVNQALESELQRMAAEFVRIAPMEVSRSDESPATASNGLDITD